VAPPPPLPEPARELTVPGFVLGHGTDREGKTGVTVVLCPEGAVGAADVRGTATGTRQFDGLRRQHGVPSKVHGFVLAGGSGFGLSAADPVVEHLAAGGHGFVTGYRPVPSVPTAILFDLAFGSAEAVPTPALVRAALEAAAPGPVACGSVGAGTGATVGKANGVECCMKGGFGFAQLAIPGGVSVAAAVVVNAVGDVRDPESGRTLAGCRTAPRSLELAGAERVLAALPPETRHAWDGNTTLGVVLTDAELDGRAARKVSEMAFGAFYRTLSPALTLYDGDLLVTLASCRQPAHVHQVAVLAQHAVERAIVAAILEADGFGLRPAARDLSG
jgi:L-aminopeptidase/D-esterase-like protein